jgi:hypothetical protein
VTTPALLPNTAGLPSSILDEKTGVNGGSATASRGDHDYLSHPLSLSPPLPKPVGKAKGGEGMRLALQTYKDSHPEIKAILIGTRRTDPHGGECFNYTVGSRSVANK